MKTLKPGLPWAVGDLKTFKTGLPWAVGGFWVDGVGDLKTLKTWLPWAVGTGVTFSAVGVISVCLEGSCFGLSTSTDDFAFSNCKSDGLAGTPSGGGGGTPSEGLAERLNGGGAETPSKDGAEIPSGGGVWTPSGGGAGTPNSFSRSPMSRMLCKTPQIELEVESDLAVEPPPWDFGPDFDSKIKFIKFYMIAFKLVIVS